MKIYHYMMHVKLPLFDPNKDQLEELGRAWPADHERPSLVVLHSGRREALEAVNAWSDDIKEKTLSVLVVGSDGFPNPPADEIAGHECVHWLSWPIPNLGMLQGGAQQGWKVDLMDRFLGETTELDRNPPDWRMLELPPRPEHLLAGYILLKLGAEDRSYEAWTSQAEEEFHRFRAASRLEPLAFEWQPEKIKETLRSCGWLDER